MERWIIEKLYADGDAKVRVINQLTGESSTTFKTQIELRAAADLQEGEKLRDDQAIMVDEAALDRITHASREGIEKIELDREMQKLPDEAMHRLNRILRYCRGAHDIKDAMESKAYEDLIHDYPLFEDYRKITLVELEEELKLPRKTYTDVVDRIASDLHQMDTNARLQLHQHLKHSFDHPAVRHLLKTYPSIELLEKLILDEIVPNPLKKKEAESTTGTPVDPAAGSSTADPSVVPSPVDSAVKDSTAEKGFESVVAPAASEEEIEAPAMEAAPVSESEVKAPKKRVIKQGNFEREVEIASLDSDKEVSVNDLDFLDD